MSIRSTSSEAMISMLWVFVILNMVYADVLALMDPTSAIRTRMVGTPVSPWFLLIGALLMETAIAMVVLSRLLSYQANRWANTTVAAVNALAVVTGGHGLYYMFFAVVEVMAMLMIVWLAWKRLEPRPKSSSRLPHTQPEKPVVQPN